MTLININSIAAASDPLLAQFYPQIPPLERDFAVCGRVEGNHTESTIPTATTYEMPVVMTGSDLLSAISSLSQSIWGVPLLNSTLTSELTATPFIQAVRASGEISSLTLTPGTASTTLPDGSMGDTSFSISATAANLNLRLAYGSGQYDIHVDTLGVVCPGVISSPIGACGEVVVRCIAPTVTMAGWSTDLPPFAVFPVSEFLPDIVRSELARRLSAGLLLHFQNRVVTGLYFETIGGISSLKLNGSHTTSCSPVPAPTPPTPPTRGLVRTETVRGYGELVGEFGNVIPFEILPEMKVDWLSQGRSRSFLPLTQLQETASPLQMFGSEIPAADGFVPDHYQIELRLAQWVPKSCYQAPLRTEQLVKLLELSSFVEVVDGGRERALVRTIPDWMLKRSVAIRVIEAANFEKEVLPLVTSLGDAELASLVGPSDWSRVAVMIDPEWPVAGPLGDVAVPLEIVFWIGVHAPELREQFGPKLACDEKSMREKVVGERVFSLPSVVFHPFLLDSAEFSSSFDAVANVGIQDRGLVQLSSRSDVPIPGGSAVKISFPAQCQVRKAGQPFAAPCWEERVLFPSQGRFAVAGGFSGTTATRLSIRDALSSGNVGAFGARVAAIQGNLDRSALETYTVVPQAYIDAGLVSMVGQSRPLDFRGMVPLDWEHGSTFSAPNGASHINYNRRTSWLFPDNTAYWANWRKDEIVLKSRILEPFSFCPLSNEVFVTPLQILVSGAGLPGDVIRPAQQFIKQGTFDAVGRVRVFNDRPAIGDFGAVAP